MKDLLFDKQRADSVRFDCEYCGKPVGEWCVNPRTGEPLVHQAAHHKRLARAGHAIAAVTQ